MRIRQTVSNKTSGYVYATYNYTYSGTKLVHMTVYNDDLHFFYDNQGRPAKVMYNGEMYTYLHNLQGDIVGIVDENGALVVEYKYNAWGKPLVEHTLNYDGKNRLKDFMESLPGESHKTSYTYDKDDRTTEIQYDSPDHKVGYTYDALGRVAGREVTNGENTYSSAFEYVAGNEGIYETGATTPMIGKIVQNGMNFEYTYDNRGNIISEKRNGLVTTYAYDALGQLVSVNDPHENAIWEYTYDLGGNITQKQKFARNEDGSKGPLEMLVPYTYGDSNWKDKLTAYNGAEITYDEIGNPTFDGTWTYEWQSGWQLKQMSKLGAIIEYKYNEAGLRVQKIVTDRDAVITTDYIYNNELVAAEKVTVVSNNVITLNELHFYYDDTTRPIMVQCHGEFYTYIRNLQGDIIAIVDEAGNHVVEYNYDAWGRVIGLIDLTNYRLSSLNLFGYRGYICDWETSLYYLRSRYFSPELGRFISCDAYVTTGQGVLASNTYTASLNNPIVYVDESGKRAIKYDANESVKEATEGLTESEKAYVLGLDNNIESEKSITNQVKRKEGWNENPNKKKGSENRQPTGARERNRAHPEGEEHSRVPKGNRGLKRKAIMGLCVTSIALVYLVANDITGFGAADDSAIIPTIAAWWDYARMAS